MVPRVAFFSDCFHEVNGVALTSRKFTEFARLREHPFLAIHSGEQERFERNGPFTEFTVPLSRVLVGVERDLSFDLLFHRHLNRLQNVVSDFGAEVIHVTSPGHIGLAGAIVAHRLGLPLAASWHTNIHEYGARRLCTNLRWLPEHQVMAVGAAAEKLILTAVLKFYRQAKVLFAPNPELVSLLERSTGKACHLMERGIDTDAFSPEFRTRSDGEFVIGFVGRLSAEKNVRLFAELDRELNRRGIRDHRFHIIGDGAEREWLKARLPGAHMPGVLKDRALSRAYADMDVFVFPSETDTYGNVIQEALASGVPCVVSRGGGPKYLVQPGRTGFVAESIGVYADAVARLYSDRNLLGAMRSNARRAALDRTWQAVFEGVYARYSGYLSPQTKVAHIVSSDLHPTYNGR